MKKEKKIAGIAVAGVGVIVAGALSLKTVWSTIRSATMSEAEIENKTEENNEIAQSVQDRYQITKPQISEEMRQSIESGEITLEEAANLILEETNTAQSSTGSEAAEQDNSNNDANTNDSTINNGVSSSNNAENTNTENSGTNTVNNSGDHAASNNTTDAAANNNNDNNNVSNANNNSGTGQTTETSNQSAQNTETGGKSTGEDNSSTTANENNNTSQETEEDVRAKNLITRLYVLQSTFTSKVDNVVAGCKAEFLALDKSEQTTANKIRIVSSHMGEVSSMESDCDSQVSAIIAELREIDPALANQAQQMYNNEKALKKASLVAQYS